MRRTLQLILVLGCMLALAAPAGDAPPKPFGIDKRVLWTTSHVVGSPDPPAPYLTRRLFPNLKLQSPLDLVRQPAGTGNRWFVVDHHGKIFSFENKSDVTQADLFIDLQYKETRPKGRQLWAMAFHPKYASNGYVYICYSEPLPEPHRNRISRFTVDLTKNPPVCDPNTEYLIFDWVSTTDHHGGCVRFGPDGMLYIPCGDGGAPGDGNLSGQDLSDFSAAISRIDVDHAPAGKTYAIPADNPFLNIPGARPELFAYGIRMAWRISFDRETGELWAGEVGQDLWDSVLRVEKGGNYGWSIMEGTHAFDLTRKRGPTPILPPIVEHEHSEARSITGGYVYRGKRLNELIGAYIYGDYDTGKIWALRYDSKNRKLLSHKELTDTALRIVGFGEDHDGELFILDYTGSVHELIPAPPQDANNPPPPFPKLLSQTGLFASTKDHQPAPGLIPYSVNAPLWSDDAHKDRFIAIPGDAKINYNPSRSPQFYGWGFPDGTVLVKTFAVDMEKGNPASRKRLETRLLHIEQQHWRGYTYLWNDEQSDAVLLEDKSGRDKKLTIKDAQAPGGIREQLWHFPSRAECTLCHTMPTGFALGFNTWQFNKDHDYGGVADNQFRVFDHLGIFSQPLSKQLKPEEFADIGSKLPHLVDPKDTKQPLDLRAKSYLFGNCAHCHMKWGGGNSDFHLSYVLSDKENMLIDAKPRHGTWGLDDPRIIAPGASQRSMLLHRMQALGQERMPRLASSVVDQDGVKLIREWIEKMPPWPADAK